MKNYLYKIGFLLCLNTLSIAQNKDSIISSEKHHNKNYKVRNSQGADSELLACSHLQKSKNGGKYTKEKKLNKVYNVNQNCLLKINNSYGNVHITTWNENKIVVDIVIKSWGNNENKTIQKLNDAKVEISTDNNIITFKTIFESSFMKWTWGDESSIQVNYTIKMPLNNSLDLVNDYGNVFLDKLNGSAKISCDYGKIEINELNNDVNQLNFDYTTKCKFGYIKNAKIVADYSGFEIEKADNISLRADYTNSKINKINKLYFECDYGDIEIKEIKNLTAKGDYISAKIGSVTGNFKLETDYGHIEVTEFTKEATNIEIKSDYSEIKLGYNADYSFDFDLNMEYGDIKIDKNLEIITKKNEDMSKRYIGKSNKNSKNKILINSSYGEIMLTQNELK